MDTCSRIGRVGEGRPHLPTYGDSSGFPVLLPPYLPQMNISSFLRATSSLFFAFGALTTTHSEASGQTTGDDFRPRHFAGASLAIAQPRGEFAEYVPVGGGLSAFFRSQVDESGWVAIRFQGSFLNYGNETKRVCFSGTVGCRVELDLTTSNNIFLIGAGPELAIPLGTSRLYGNATAGYSYFWTDSKVGGTVEDEPFASTTNYSDGGFSWSFGGGLEIGLGRAGDLPILLDLGFAHHGNGRREYLTEGGITDTPGGEIELDVKRSDAGFFLWRLGVSVGLRGG